MKAREIYIVVPVDSSDLNTFQPQGRVAGKYFDDEASADAFLKKLPERKSAIVYRVACHAEEEVRRITEALSFGEKANLEKLQLCEYKVYSKSNANMSFSRFDPKAPPSGGHAKSPHVMFNSASASLKKTDAPVLSLTEKLKMVQNENYETAIDLLKNNINDLDDEKLLGVLYVYSRGRDTELDLPALLKKNGRQNYLMNEAMSDGSKALGILYRKALVDTFSDEDLVTLYLKQAQAIEHRYHGTQRPGQIIDARMNQARKKVVEFRIPLDKMSKKQEEVSALEASNDAKLSQLYLYLSLPKNACWKGKRDVNPSKTEIKDALEVADIIAIHANGLGGMQYLKEVDLCLHRPDAIFELAMFHPRAAIHLLQNEMIAKHLSPLQLAQIARKYVKEQEFYNSIEMVNNPVHPEARLARILERAQALPPKERQQVEQLFNSADMKRLLESERIALSNQKHSDSVNASYNGGDPYQDLQLERGASQQDIKKAYLELSKKYHPDRLTGSPDASAQKKFQAAKEAYKFLSDESKKAAYDRSYPAKTASASAGRKY